MPQKLRYIILPIFLGCIFVLPVTLVRFEYRWEFNPAALIAPWLAILGFVAGFSRNQRFPHAGKVALAFCLFQLLINQIGWAYHEWRRSHTEETLFSYYLSSLTGSEQEDFIESSDGGMLAVPPAGKKGYALYLVNLSMWTVSTAFVVRYCARKGSPRIRTWRRNT